MKLNTKKTNRINVSISKLKRIILEELIRFDEDASLEQAADQMVSAGGFADQAKKALELVFDELEDLHDKLEGAPQKQNLVSQRMQMELQRYQEEILPIAQSGDPSAIRKIQDYLDLSKKPAAVGRYVNPEEMFSGGMM